MITNRLIRDIIKNANEEFNQNGNSEKFKYLCNKVLTDGSINHIISFASEVNGVDIKSFGLIVASNGNAEQNFKFAKIQGCDSRLHRDKILQSGDVEYNLRAGKQLKDNYREEYVNKHGAIVLTGTAYQNLKYITENTIETLNRQAHFDAIIKSNNAYINYICARQVKDADILAHGQVVIDSKDVHANFAFASIAGADVKSHLNTILEFGTEYDCLEVLRSFDCADKTKFVIKIFDGCDDEVKIKCLKWLESKNLLQKAKRLDTIYDFIEQLKLGYVSDATKLM